MSLFDNIALAGEALGIVAALGAAGWLGLKAIRLWRPPQAAGRNAHALSPILAAIDPFRSGDDPAFAALRPEQVASIQWQSGFHLSINIANAAVTAAVLATTADPTLLVLWCAAVVWVTARGIKSWARHRHEPAPPSVSKRTIRRVTSNAAVLGLLWGLGFAMFYGASDGVGRIVLIALGVGMAAGGTVALAPAPGAAAAFAAGVFVPGAIRLVTTGEPGDLALAALCVLYACSMGATLGAVYDFFARNVLARDQQRLQADTIALLLNTYEEHAAGWLWQADSQGVLCNSPPRMEELLQVPSGSLAGRPLWAPCAEGSAGEGWAELMRDLRDGRPFRDHVVEARRARDGGRLWLSLSGRRFADGYWHGLGTDVTRREEALRFQAEAMEQATAGIQAKSQFLATMSHELRTPLNAIIGFSELLDAGYAGPLTDKQREYLADIRHSGAYLLDLVNDILDLSKAEAGRVEIADETIELASLVAEVLRIVAPQATAGGIALDMKIDPALPPVLGDARRIKQVLLNLVSNAVKFTPAGGRVEVSAALGADGSLALAITDTGIGMSESDIPRALERFGQIDSRLERRYAGTGIGLPLAKKLAELHGGSLTLESAVGVGTRATVMLPASRVAGPQLGTSPPSTL